ncbi:MAG: hypothetical protein IJW96_01700 [Clostridia bacterium]|nr:hypothetical protein [Clostridia bacterium]
MYDLVHSLRAIRAFLVFLATTPFKTGTSKYGVRLTFALGLTPNGV